MLRKFTLFGTEMHSYSAAICLAVITGSVLMFLALRKKNYSLLQLFLLQLVIIISFFIGARLFNIALNTKYYMLNPNASFEFKLSGFSVFGGILVSFVATFILLRIMKKPIYAFYDSAAIAFLICFAIAKCGCFLNGCCGGKPSNSFLAIQFPQKDDPLSTINSLIKIVTLTPTKVYPTQLFEAVLTALFIPIAFKIKKSNKNLDGKLFFISGIYLCSVRLLIHFFRSFPYPPIVVNLLYPLFYVLMIIVLGVMFYRHSKKLNEKIKYQS